MESRREMHHPGQLQLHKGSPLLGSGELLEKLSKLIKVIIIPQKIFLTGPLIQNQSPQDKYHSLKFEIILQKEKKKKTQTTVL